MSEVARQSVFRTYMRLVGMLLKDRPFSFLFYWGLILIQAFLPALSVLLLADLFDIGGQYIQGESELKVFIFIAILYVVVHVGQSFMNMVIHIFFMYIQRSLVAALDERIFQKTERIKLARFEESSFFDQFQRARSVIASGRFLNFMRRAVTGVQSFLTVITMASVILHFSIWLAISLVIAALPITILRIRRGKQFWQLHYFQSPKQRMLGYLSQILIGREEAKELRAFHASNYILGKWKNLRDELREERWHFEKKNLKKEILYSTATTEVFAYALSIVIAVGAVFRGDLEVSGLAATLMALRTFQDMVRMTFIDFSFAMEGSYYVNDLFQFIDDPHEETWDQPTLFPKKLTKGIHMENVTFTYPGGKEPALKDVTCHINPGERVAIVGENGAGKSTFVKLLLGLYEPDEGRITYDDRDVHSFNIETFRSEISMVPQDFVRYQLTVRENVGFGDVEKMDDDSRVVHAMELGGAKEFVSELPKQLDTRLGKDFPESTDLSGGQWQRIATSRGFMRTPQVMVLDEPTASLDPLQEAEVFERFAKMAQGRTTIMVSHRLASCKLADRILVFSKGRLIEMGTHEELMALNGEYAAMYREQAKWYQ